MWVTSCTVPSLWKKNIHLAEFWGKVKVQGEPSFFCQRETSYKYLYLALFILKNKLQDTTVNVKCAEQWPHSGLSWLTLRAFHLLLHLSLNNNPIKRQKKCSRRTSSLTNTDVSFSPTTQQQHNVRGRLSFNSDEVIKRERMETARNTFKKFNSLEANHVTECLNWGRSLLSVISGLFAFCFVLLYLLNHLHLSFYPLAPSLSLLCFVCWGRCNGPCWQLVPPLLPQGKLSPLSFRPINTAWGMHVCATVCVCV